MLCTGKGRIQSNRSKSAPLEQRSRAARGGHGRGRRLTHQQVGASETMADDKQLARQFVQELLTKIGQIDGEQRRDAVKHQIRDAGREYGRLKELVREQTALYAPELKERWEDILRRTEAARPGAVPANPAGLAGGTPPAHPAQHPTHPRQPAQVVLPQCTRGGVRSSALLCFAAPPRPRASTGPC